MLCTKKIIHRLNKSELSWNDLLFDGAIDESIIEYIDSYEQNNSMIAMEPEYLNNNDSKYIYHYTLERIVFVF